MKKMMMLALCSMVIPVMAGEKVNLLRNGDFESWGKVYPKFFAVAPKAGAPISADSKVFKSGKYSLKISSTMKKSARLTQRWIPIKDFVEPICIKGWIKYENLAAKDANGKRCNMPLICLWTYLPNGRNSLILPAVACKPGSRDWFQFEKVFTPQELAAKIAKLPENRRPTHMNFRVTVYNQPGTIWLDDVEMFEVEPEAKAAK